MVRPRLSGLRLEAARHGEAHVVGRRNGEAATERIETSAADANGVRCLRRNGEAATERIETDRLRSAECPHS